MATKTEEVKRLQEKYCSQIIKFEQERKIEFSDYNDWIEFVAVYFANHYKEHLEYWRATAVDDRAEYRYWQKKLNTEIGQVYDAFTTILNHNYEYYCEKKRHPLGRLGIRKYDILLDTKKNAGSYQYVLNAIGSISGPRSAFFNNVRYTMSFNEKGSKYQFSWKLI